MLPPVWLTDKAAMPVIDLLRWFVQQLNQTGFDERSRPLSRKLNPQTIPALFDYTRTEEIDFLWEAIVELANPIYGIWALVPEKARSSGLVNKSGLSYKSGLGDKSAKVILRLEAEPVLRQWLNMPRVDPHQTAWITAIAKASERIPVDMYALAQSNYPGIYPPDRIIDALLSLHDFMATVPQEKYSWRRLSARFFFGDSKYLDGVGRQQWLLTIFPLLSQFILERTLLLNAHLVHQPSGILVIENLDTFCWLREMGAKIPCVQPLHLIYSQGFMGGAQRIRSRQSIQFSFSGAHTEMNRFADEWLEVTEQTLPYYFWGDLDFSALGILNALRKNFPTLVAWQPGYKPMVDALQQGIGHSPADAEKIRQLAPVPCGCDYADQVLLPCLLNSGRFIDQEWVSHQLLCH